MMIVAPTACEVASPELRSKNVALLSDNFKDFSLSFHGSEYMPVCLLEVQANVTQLATRIAIT